MKPLILPLALVLSGCATCQEHPLVCSAAGALIAGSIVLAAQHHSHQPNDDRRTILPVDCSFDTRCK